MHLLFDLETNGLLDRQDLKILCGAAVDVLTGHEFLWKPDKAMWPPVHPASERHTVGNFDHMFMVLGQADELIGHNIAGFDLPVLERFAPPGWTRTDRIYDTIAASRAMYFSNMVKRSAIFRNKAGRSDEAKEKAYPKKFLVPHLSHKLEAWGYRLKYHKGEFLNDLGVQEEFSEELLDYCMRDVRLNVKLWEHLTTRPAIPGSPVTAYEAMVVESQVTYWLEAQQRNGVGFNEALAAELWGRLSARREELLAELQRDHFPDYYVGKDFVSPKRSMTSRKFKPGEEGYKNVEKDCPYSKIEKTTFTGTRHQIADRLQKLHGWKPKAWGADGVPTVDEKTLKDLDFPPIPALVESLMIRHRLGQLAEGKQSYMKCCDDGIIHGRVFTTGARTGRMSHSKPNMNVPKVSSPYGPEFRELFTPTRPGWVQVGADASGLQLRMLAHRLGRWDGGEFARILLESDPHTEWMKASKIFIRDHQKTLTYAFLFGAQDPKLGEIRLDDWRDAYAKGITATKPPARRFAKSLGEDARAGLLQHVNGLDPLMKACKRAYKKRWLVGLDGRVIAIASEHGALNDLLQGDEAVVMKHALLERGWLFEAEGLQHGKDWAQLLNVHDEWQIETFPENAELVGELSVRAIKEAGKKLGLRVELDGEYKVGANWKETH